METKQTYIAVRNISNRPLSFEFPKESITVLPGKVSKFYLESEWQDTFAEKQLKKYVNDREAVIKTNVKTVTVNDSIQHNNRYDKKNKRKGDK